MWNLLCQYNNIYTSLHKYLKGKKKSAATVAIVPLGTVVTVQNLGKKSSSQNQSTVVRML